MQMVSRQGSADPLLQLEQQWLIQHEVSNRADADDVVFDRLFDIEEEIIDAAPETLDGLFAQIRTVYRIRTMGGLQQDPNLISIDDRLLAAIHRNAERLILGRLGGLNVP